MAAAAAGRDEERLCTDPEQLKVRARLHRPRARAHGCVDARVHVPQKGDGLTYQVRAPHHRIAKVVGKDRVSSSEQPGGPAEKKATPSASKTSKKTPIEEPNLAEPSLNQQLEV